MKRIDYGRSLIQPYYVSRSDRINVTVHWVSGKPKDGVHKLLKRHYYSVISSYRPTMHYIILYQRVTWPSIVSFEWVGVLRIVLIVYTRRRQCNNVFSPPSLWDSPSWDFALPQGRHTTHIYIYIYVHVKSDTSLRSWSACSPGRRIVHDGTVASMGWRWGGRVLQLLLLLLMHFLIW